MISPRWLVSLLEQAFDKLSNNMLVRYRGRVRDDDDEYWSKSWSENSYKSRYNSRTVFTREDMDDFIGVATKATI